jgi:hypothetical protein
MVMVLGGLKLTADVVVPLVKLQLALAPVGMNASSNMARNRTPIRREPGPLIHARPLVNGVMAILAKACEFDLACLPVTLLPVAAQMKFFITRHFRSLRP